MSWISFGPCGGWGHADACPAVHKTGDGMESMVLPGTGPELKPSKLVTLSVNMHEIKTLSCLLLELKLNFHLTMVCITNK